MIAVRETGCWRCKRHFNVEPFDEEGKCPTCGWDYCPFCQACHPTCAEFRERVYRVHPPPDAYGARPML